MSILISCRIAGAVSSNDLEAALDKYAAGRALDAIADLENVMNSLNYQTDKVRFIRTTHTLLDLYWWVEDGDGIHRVVERTVEALQKVIDSQQPFDDLDRFLFFLRESYRMREELLNRDLSAAREIGVNLLERLTGRVMVLHRAAGLNVLVTFAMISRAEFRIAEAESYMHQAIGRVLSEDSYYGLAAVAFLESLLRHYMESGQYQYAGVIVQRLLEKPDTTANISPRSIQGLSLSLLVAELLLQTVTVESSDPLLQLLLGLEQVEGSIQGVPTRLKIALHAMLLYLQLQRKETDGARRSFAVLETLYRGDPNNPRGVANVLAWAALGLGSREIAIHYATAGHSEAKEINVFLYPLNRLVAAELDRADGRPAEAVRNAQEGLQALLTNIATRAVATPTTVINLSFVDRAVIIDFVQLALDLSSTPSIRSAFNEPLSIAVQLLQRDRVPRGALFAPGLLTASTANVEEHLRAREHLAQARYGLFREAVDILLERIAMRPGGAPPKVYDFGEMNRLLQYTFRINELDSYLQSLLYSQKQFIFSRLALVPPQDVQRILASDEALISHVAIASDRLLVECITRDTVQFFPLQVDWKAFISNVRLLNLSLADPRGPSSILDSQYPAPAAVATFQTLFSAAEACFRDKTRLVIATEPALLGIPFNALLTGMPRASDQGYDLKNAPWMIRQWALSIALARSTLVYQRSFSNLSRPRKSLIGFGNPRFAGNPGVAHFVDPRSIYDARGGTRGDAIRGLPALPDTETELYAIRSHLGSGDGVLFLGDDATERNVRSVDLDDYKVIVFATHGLTAGDFDSLTEPALALTPIDNQDTRNDGLLRMSEISRLWMAADLVVLSACNTAAGDGTPSSTGFNGLVNAFFFAGARAVLASQWPVVSQMAEALTTGMFAAAASAPNLPPSVALQRSMLHVIDDSPDSAYAHPRFWAPFLVAGDGSHSAAAAESLPTSSTSRLATRWERNLGEKLFGEILEVAVDKDGSVYAAGFTEPKNGRAKSLVLALGPDGAERWRVEDPSVGAGAHILQYAEDRLASAGYVWSEKFYEGVMLRGFDSQNGTELWRKVIDTPGEEHTLGLFREANGHILWVISSNPDARESKDPRLKIMLATVDADGAVVSERSQELRGDEFRLSSGRVVARWQGNLLVAWAWSKSVTDVSEMFGKGSSDPTSGYSSACSTRRLTELILVEESTGRLLNRKTIDGLHVKSFATARDGRLLVSAEVWDKCLGHSDAAVAEVAGDLSVKILFRYGGPLEKSAGHIATLPDGRLVFVGRITTLFDLDPYVKLDLSASWRWRGWTGEFFENDRRTFSAFVVLLDEQGNFLADRVIRDLRGRLIRAAAGRTDDSIAFGGLANGVSSWLGVIDVK